MKPPVLLQGDCLDAMWLIPDGSVDMVLCDLPYGTTACKWDSVIPFEPLWSHYWRVLKPNGAVVLTAAQPFTSALVLSNPKTFKYQWVWLKEQGTGFANAKKQPLRKHEDILVFYKSQCTYKPQGLVKNVKKRKHMESSVGRALGQNGLHGREFTQEFSNYPTSILEFPRDRCKLHPTQKPVALMEYLIRTYTNEGETVLDNCMGSGTTGVACKNTGRNFIGIERDPEYFRIAKERIE